MGERFNIKDIDKERYIAIPMALFTQENYAGLDNTARLIYDFLKSRLNLSRINKWFDESGDIFLLPKSPRWRISSASQKALSPKRWRCWKMQVFWSVKRWAGIRLIAFI